MIYINDLPFCSTLLALLFADDTTLLAAGDDIEELVQYVNIEFKKIVTFFRSNKLSLHPDKTQFILFSNSNVVKNKEINLYIDMNNEHENDPNLVKISKELLPIQISQLLNSWGCFSILNLILKCKSATSHLKFE